MDIQLERIQSKGNPSNSRTHYSSFNPESRTFDYFFDEITTEFCCNNCSFKSKIKSNTIRHIRTHSGFKPYKCEICYSAFAKTGYLKSHMLIHTFIGVFGSLYKRNSESC